MQIRNDSWAAKLTEDQAWALFYKSRRCDWNVAAAWAKREFHLEKLPSRTSFYDWKSKMQREEHAHVIAQSLLAQEEAKTIAQKYGVTDEESVQQLMSAATNAQLLRDDPSLAGQLIEMAMLVKEKAQADKQLEIEERKIKVKEEDLVIARERLRLAIEKEERTKKVISNTKLTPEERERKIKEIFGFS